MTLTWTRRLALVALFLLVSVLAVGLSIAAKRTERSSPDPMREGAFRQVGLEPPGEPAAGQPEGGLPFEEAMNLTLGMENGDPVLEWDAVDGATGYDVLASGDPAFTLGLQFLAIDMPATSTTDPLPLPFDALRFYLVRPRGQNGFGPWHFGSDGGEVLGPEQDGEGDGFADLIDNCQQSVNPLQVDIDDDGVGDLCDNCQTEANPDQNDGNQDGGGDACQPSYVITRCGTPFLPSPGIAPELFDANHPHPLMPGVVHPVIQFSSALMDFHRAELATISGLDPGASLAHNVLLAAVDQVALGQLAALNFVRSVFPLPPECRESDDPACPHLEYGRWNIQDADPSPAGLQKHAIAYDSIRERVVLFGGEDEDLTEATWEYDGSGWNLSSPANKPPPRIDHAMAYFEEEGVVVMFGGFAKDPTMGVLVESNDTWEWDGIDWKQVLPLNPPPPRRGHAMAYDRVNKLIVLFGGSDTAGSILPDTWVWDGVDWQQLDPAEPPEPLTEHAMAFDVTREEVVLFGGGGENGTVLNTTWTLDGDNWIKRDPTDSPPPRFSHAMASHDPACGVLLYGGFDAGGNALEDTWHWNGLDWYLVSTPSLPPVSRGEHAMARDSVREQTVLFGGNSAGFTLDDTWEFEASHITEVRFHHDVPLPVADAILTDHDAIILQPGVIISGTHVVNSWQAAVPDSEISPLVAEEPVIFAQVVGVNENLNDGSRTAVQADAAQAAPFCGGGGCSGDDIVWAQWEGYWAAGDPGGPSLLGGAGAHAALTGRTLVRDRPGGLVGPVAPMGCTTSIGCDNCSYDRHATHVAGTILGDGTGSGIPTMKGMSPSSGAKIISYDVSATQPVAEMNCEITDAIDNFGARLANNSWGTSVFNGGTTQLGLYDGFSLGLDDHIDATPAATIFFAAGNWQGSRGPEARDLPPIYNAPSAGGSCSTPPPLIGEPGPTVRNGFYTLSEGRGQAAKNTLVVGAINSGAPSVPLTLGRMTKFSSWGPTQDGRIKPDLVAAGAENNDGTPGDPGIFSTSCMPNLGNCVTVDMGYIGSGGTSMSSPAAAGAAGLVLQQQAITGVMPGDTPLDADSLKALLIHTATDLAVHFPLGGAFMTLQDCSGDMVNDDCWPVPAVLPGTVQDGPDYVNGWGLINAQVAVQKVIAGNPDVTIRPSGCPSDVTYSPLGFNSPLPVGGDPVTTIGIAGCLDTFGNPLTRIWDWVGYIQLPPGTTQLKVTIAWNDPQPAVKPTLGDTGTLLVNDLDLVVSPVTGIGGSITGPHNYSWYLDPTCPYLQATPVVSDTMNSSIFSDHRNTVEQVIVNSPSDGWWRIVVQSLGVAAGPRPQEFAIIISMPPSLP